MPKRIVINIGGTSRSGSTLLNLILANDRHAVSVGEIHAMLYPTRKHHFTEIKNIKNQKWASILAGGKEKLYANIFNSHPELNVIVDSSKSPFWIKGQNKYCEKEGIVYKNVLIFKTPYEIAKSFVKRNKPWVFTYINYHRKYFSLIQSCFVISYMDLVTQEKPLEHLCQWIGIGYSTTKKQYWNTESPLFFGSSTPKGKNHIIHDEATAPALKKTVEEEIRQNDRIVQIWNFLIEHNTSVIKNPNESFELSCSRFELYLYNIKNIIRRTYKRFFPETYISKRFDQ